MKINSYKELLVWQKGIEIADLLRRFIDKFPRYEQIFGSGLHLKKTAESIPSNIAEGNIRQYTKEYIQFLYVSLGSCAELDTKLIIAKNAALISESDYQMIYGLLEQEMKMVYALIRKLKGRV
jgi:four helix bundle protein